MIGKRLKDLRHQKEISQKELAKQLDVVISNVSMYESDERTPSPEVLIKISQYFNCSVDYLLGLIDEKNGFIKVPDGYVAVLSEALDNNVSPDKLKKLIEFAKQFEDK